MDEQRSGGFLPPEPAGPEPELGSAPAEQPTQRLPDPGPQAPAAGQPGPPAARRRHQPQAPPGAGPSSSLRPTSSRRLGATPSRPSPTTAPPSPASFCRWSPAACCCSAAGSEHHVDRLRDRGDDLLPQGQAEGRGGETRKNRGLAQAGFVIGIVSLVLSLLATAFWVLLAALAVTDEEFQRDFENEFDETDSIRASVRVVLALA